MITEFDPEQRVAAGVKYLDGKDKDWRVMFRQRLDDLNCGCGEHDEKVRLDVDDAYTCPLGLLCGNYNFAAQQFNLQPAEAFELGFYGLIDVDDVEGLRTLCPGREFPDEMVSSAAMARLDSQQLNRLWAREIFR